MKKLLLWSVLASLPLAADEFLKDYAETRGYLLGRPVKAKLTEQGRCYFLRSQSRTRSQSLYEWVNGQAVLRLTPEQVLQGQDEKLTPEEKARNERKRQLGTGFTEYFLRPHSEQLLLPISGQLILFDGQKWEKLPVAPGVLDPQWSPDGQKLAYVRGYDVHYWDFKSRQERPLTKGGTREVTHGIAEFVAQEEMHRLSGYCWSPNSQSIAFQQADHRGVEVWQISDPLHPETPPQVQYYPRPRQKNVRSRLGIAALKGAPVRWLPIPDEYLASLRWTAQGLTVQVQDRRQQRLRLLLDTPKGWKTLVEERHPAWVPLSQEVPLWLDKQHFLYLRLQQDHMALAECSLDGKTRFLEPQADYDILEILGLNTDKSAVLCRIDQQPGNPRLHWLPIRGQAPADPSEAGVTEAFLGKKGLLIGQQSMQGLPRLLLDGQEISGVGESPARLPEVSFETVSAQGLEFRTAMLRPRDFDPKLRYPVILDAYGGPTKVQVAHNLRAWLMDQWLADQGFIVVSVDNRGTPGRGRAWETAVYGKFDSVPIGDQEAALRALCAGHPYLDEQRIGVWGWSFGGFLAAQSVLQRPEFFKAAVAGAPVTDWDDYDTHYTERYLGTDSAPYRASDLTRRASSLNRPLLLVHGSADDNVYYRHSLRLSEALLRNGQPHQLLTLPGITHSFRADVQITRELWRRSVEFFQEHLGKPR